MSKSPDAFRTISEVADWLGVQTHVLRFWESKFPQIKPIKRAGGRRYYRPADMLLLGGVKKLLHDDGLTIKGVQKILREQGAGHVSAESKPLDDDTVNEPVLVTTSPIPQEAIDAVLTPTVDSADDAQISLDLDVPTPRAVDTPAPAAIAPAPQAEPEATESEETVTAPEPLTEEDVPEPIAIPEDPPADSEGVAAAGVLTTLRGLVDLDTRTLSTIAPLVQELRAWHDRAQQS